MTKNHSEVNLKILDFLYTVVISLGILPSWYGLDWVDGLFEKTWFREATIPHGGELFDSLVLILVFLVVTFSWYSYHKSVTKYPHKGFTGLVRFSIDLFLLLIYGAMFIHHNKFEVALFLLILVFTLYWIWDIILGFGYEKKEPFKSQKSLYFSMLFVILFISYILFLKKHLVLLLSFALVIFYRIFSNFPISFILDGHN